MQLDRQVEPGEILEVDNKRGEQLVNATVGEIIGSTPDIDTKAPLKTEEKVENPESLENTAPVPATSPEPKEIEGTPVENAPVKETKKEAKPRRQRRSKVN